MAKVLIKALFNLAFPLYPGKNIEGRHSSERVDQVKEGTHLTKSARLGNHSAGHVFSIWKDQARAVTYL